MKRVNHNFIIRVYDIVQDENHVYIIMDFCDGGTIFDYIKQNEHTEARAAKIIYQILAGVNHMHSLNIIHRDLKLENILCEQTKK